MECFEPAFEYVSPGVEINSKIGKLILDHYNTRIREFLPPNELFNHVEFAYDDETGQRRVMGLHPDEETMAIFKRLEFPRLVMPFVDGPTMEWLVKTSSDDLASAENIDDFSHGGDATDDAS